MTTDDDIVQALDLARCMFLKYDSPDYGVEHTERMRAAIEDRLNDSSIYCQRLHWWMGKWQECWKHMERTGVLLLFVEGGYRHKGIAMMRKIAEELKLLDGNCQLFI